MANFVSAKELSANVTTAQIYTGYRSVDYGKLCAEFTGQTGESTIVLANGYSVALYTDGGVALVDPDCMNGQFFRTWVQFAAYYLAKFW